LFVYNAGRDIFRKHKDNMFKKAQKLANTTYSVIARSCNKLMIGKTYWKTLVLPSILYGNSLISFPEKDIERLQRIENSVYRHILGAPSYAPICTLKGEVGASNMKSRIIKDRIMYLKSIYDGENELLKEIVREMLTNESKWMKITKKYMDEIGIRVGELRSLKKEELKEHIKKWREELNKKPV
jgi:hypothetical protein